MANDEYDVSSFGCLLLFDAGANSRGSFFSKVSSPHPLDTRPPAVLGRHPVRNYNANADGLGAQLFSSETLALESPTC